MIEKLIAMIEQRYFLSKDEAELLRSKMTEVSHFHAGQTIVREGQRLTFSSLLIDGFSSRMKGTIDGSRHNMQFNVVGDFVDLHSYPLEILDHSAIAVTHCRIVKFYHQDITTILNERPRLGRILWFATMVDASSIESGL